MSTMTERKHAQYSPSKLALWQKCPGWVSDGQSSAAAARGTDIGEKIAALIKGEDVPANHPEYEAIAKGCDLASSFLADNGYNSDEWDLMPEMWLDSGMHGCTGYADIVAIQPFLGIALLIEIKTGRGEREAAADNMQVTGYAAGCIRNGADRVVCCLIEVDKGTSSQCVYIASELEEMQAKINDTIAAHLEATPEQYINGGYCDYCGRATTCPKLVTALTEIQTEIAPKEVIDALSVEDLGGLLSKITPLFDRAESYYGAVKGRVMQIIEAGGEVPGWHIKYTPGNRKWSDEKAALDALAEGGFDAKLFVELISPAKADKVLGKKKEIVAPFIEKGVQKKSLQEVK